MRFDKKHIGGPIQIKEVALYFLALVILLLSFQGNIFNAASDRFFNGHQRDSEALVLGRMIETNHNGYFSQGGFLGSYADPDWIGHQYRAYEEDFFPESTYRRYTSSAGFQGFFYGFTDSLLNAVGMESGKSKLFINKLITSFALASLVAFFVVFSFRQFGLFSALTVLLLLTLSQWLVVFSNNLYWMFFLIVLPFFTSLFFLNKESSEQKALSMELLCFAMFIAVLIKSLAGYEYMSTIMIAMVTPFLFFFIRDSWSFKQLVKRVFLVSIAALAGFILAILIHILQLSYFLGGLSKGLNIVWGTVIKRTHGNPDDVHEVYRASLESGTLEVISKYWNGVAFDLNSIVGAFGAVRFGELIIFSLGVSIATTLLIHHKFPAKKRLNYAILASIWMSVLAPISWYVLAKGHSYIHTHMNHVLWYVPFLFFVFAYIGFTFDLFVRLLLRLKPKQRTFIAVSFAVLSCALFFYTAVNSYTKKQSLVNSSKELARAKQDGLSINYNDRDLVFVSSDCGESLATRFFLHLVPASVELLPEPRQQYGFDNLDFNWAQNQIAGQSWFVPNDICVAKVSLPQYPVTGIRTGQYNQDGRLWESHIDLTDMRFATEVQPFDLTDGNWINGISRNRSGFFVENTFENRQSLRVGDILVFAHSGERVVQQITYSNRYINVFVSGDSLSLEADGFPNTIGLKK